MSWRILSDLGSFFCARRLMRTLTTSLNELGIRGSISVLQLVEPAEDRQDSGLEGSEGHAVPVARFHRAQERGRVGAQQLGHVGVLRLGDLVATLHHPDDDRSE